MSGVRGYKVFNPDWTCRNFQYEVGKTFEEEVIPICCDRGFHFCKELKDCFNYYQFDPNNKVAEIIALGDVDDDGGNSSKCCTNKIQIAREISWQEVLDMVNLGKGCTGLCNTGNRNTGNRNTGNRNTGNYNTGDCNTGNYNTGNRNTGDCNTGDWNTGDCNTGDCNTGNYNTGNRNTGDWNTGDCNTGNRNTGDCNTGDCNTGDCNTGDCNTGDCNTGNYNTGNRNTGDWNDTNFSSGCFNTIEQKIYLFDKSSDWTYRDWLDSDARYLLNQIQKNVVEWVYESDMTDEEKNANPTYKTTGGYLKVLDESQCAQLWWDDLREDERETIRSIPNFDKDKFEQITGIKIRI